jgi:KRAB domain-containing zinc finger protein
MREIHGIFKKLTSKHKFDLEKTDILCDMCGFAAASNRSMRIHADSQCKFSFNTKNIPCRQCDKIMRSYQSLKVHVRDVHERKYTTCAECGFQANTSSKLQTHNYEAHMHGDTKCAVCGTQKKNAYRLLIHMKNSHPGSALKCHLCNETFGKLTLLKIHLKFKHKFHYFCRKDEVRYDCDQCDFKATTKCSLTTHKQSKHEEVTTPGEPEETSVDSLIGRFRRFISQISPAGEEPHLFPELEAVLASS